MISLLTGTISQVTEKTITLEVNGVGYEIFITPSLQSQLSSGQGVTLHTHLNVREDAMELYGFNDIKERDFFRQLISISGVGPKSALGVLTVASVTEIKQAVASGDASVLIKVSGIGRKTAERIVVELKEKIAVEMLHGSPGASAGDASIIDALTSLGYSIQEAREAIKQIPANMTELDERLKIALKSLGRYGD
ncbi:MAG: Holliday junction branch migration protein RuvA [bacterium]